MIALVTGANQGLGLALVRGLCRQYPDGSAILLGARDAKRGEEAVASLRAEGLYPELSLIDVTNDSSVSECAARIRERHGGIDIVISNAAARITKDAPIGEQVERFIDTNNHGTSRMIKAFVPLLNDGARFLVVASGFGSLRHLDPSLHHHFDLDSMTLEDVERVMDAYARKVVDGTAHQDGWPEWINIPSKIGQVASLKILAREQADEARARGILFNAVCPGLVDTEASRPWFDDMSTAQTPDAAAVDVNWLATLPAGTAEPYGELVQKRKVLRFR